MINLVAHSRAGAFAFTGSAKPGSLSHPEQQCSHSQVQGRVLKPGAKETVISEVIMLLSVPLVVFPLSALSLTGIKLALFRSQQDTSTSVHDLILKSQPGLIPTLGTQVHSRSQHMATQPEKSHSTHTVFTFHYDKISKMPLQLQLQFRKLSSQCFLGLEPELQSALCASGRQKENGTEVLPFFHHEREGTSLARKYNSLLRKNFKGNSSSACTLQVQAHKESNLQIKFNLKVMKEGTGTKGRVTESHWLFQMLETKYF